MYIIVFFPCVVIVNSRDVPIRSATQLASNESLSSVRVENHELENLFYMLNFPIIVPNVPSCISGSGLNSSGDEGDSLMSEVIICVPYLAHVEFNSGLVLFEITTQEIGCLIQSLEKIPLNRCSINKNCST